MDSNLSRIARIISSCFEILKYASFAKKKIKDNYCPPGNSCNPFDYGS